MEPSISSLPESLARPFPDKDNDSPHQTTATDSPISCELLPDADRDGLSSKTSPDCLMHPVNLEEAPVHSLETYCDRFPKSGTWGSGWFSVQPALDCPTIESDCLSLPTPTALSSRASRPPGQNKLEVRLKQLGLIQRGEVANPELLETMFGLPMGYSFPLELTRETPLPADDAKPLEIPSAENVRSQPSEEFCTSIPLVATAKESGGEYSDKGKNLKSNSQSVIQPLLGDEENSPSNSPSKVDLSPSKRQRGFGNGCIHWRTITSNGKDYPQAYYHWKENGQKRTKYIPKQLLGLVEEAEKQKRPVIEILQLLGVGSSPSNLLGDEKNSPSNDENLLGDKQVNTAESIEINRFLDSPSKSEKLRAGVLYEKPRSARLPPVEQTFQDSPSNEISPSKRRKGDGSGSIHWRTITRGGKDYPQAYYHYEFWSGGDRLIKSSRYIPKKLLAQVQQLDAEKAPVREILQVLGVMV